MALRRRELRCFLFFFIAVVVVSSLSFGSGYFQPRFGDVSFLKFEVPDWRGHKDLPQDPEEIEDDEDVQRPDTNSHVESASLPTPIIDIPTPPSSEEVFNETTIPGGAYIQGLTVLDNLYMRNGTFYILTSNVSQFPSRSDMIAKPLSKAEGINLEPTDQVSS